MSTTLAYACIQAFVCAYKKGLCAWGGYLYVSISSYFFEYIGRSVCCTHEDVGKSVCGYLCKFMAEANSCSYI